MEIQQLKKMIDKNIIDFSELLLDNYHEIGLDEIDTIILIKLHRLLKKNISFISPKKLSETLSISAATTSKHLNSLIDRDFIRMALVKGENGKEKETYSLDKIYEKFVDIEEQHPEQSNTAEKEIVELFEDEFKRPLSVLEIQTIIKWLQDDHYTFDQIKDALFQAIQTRKLAIKYIDGILLKTQEEPKKVYKKTNLMRDLHKLWEK